MEHIYSNKKKNPNVVSLIENEPIILL